MAPARWHARAWGEGMHRAGADRAERVGRRCEHSGITLLSLDGRLPRTLDMRLILLQVNSDVSHMGSLPSCMVSMNPCRHRARELNFR